ncbi:hypothetical protein ACJZ2D_001226 [Fusarium nematophilum]
MSPASLDALPQEISNNITSRLSKYDLLNLRCVSRALSLKAAPEAFHTIHRLAYGSSSQRFMQLAESKFSGLVQEVTCDSWNRPDYRYDGFVFCPDFWDALPFLGLFRNMNTLHIRLQPAGGHFEDGRTSRYKFGMLQVIFCSLAGAWSKKSQKWLDDYALGYWDKVDGYERNRWPDTLPTSPVPLSTLTILNLDSRRTSDFSGVGWVGTILAGLEDLRIGATRDLILGQTGDSLGLEKLPGQHFQHQTHTAISRFDSPATFPANAAVLRVSSYVDESFLVSALKGQHVLVLRLNPRGHDRPGAAHLRRSKGRRSLRPAHRVRHRHRGHGDGPRAGPHDVSDKKAVRDLVEELGVSSWIAVVNGLWFDWFMEMGSWGIDIRIRRAEMWDGGNVKANTSTLRRVGDVVAELLSLLEEELWAYRNKLFYVSSFCVTQREMLESVQRATGTTDADWEITDRDIGGLIAECDERLKRGGRRAAIPKMYAAQFKGAWRELQPQGGHGSVWFSTGGS